MTATPTAALSFLLPPSIRPATPRHLCCPLQHCCCPSIYTLLPDCCAHLPGDVYTDGAKLRRAHTPQREDPTLRTLDPEPEIPTHWSENLEREHHGAIHRGEDYHGAITMERDLGAGTLDRNLRARTLDRTLDRNLDSIVSLFNSTACTAQLEPTILIFPCVY